MGNFFLSGAAYILVHMIREQKHKVETDVVSRNRLQEPRRVGGLFPPVVFIVMMASILLTSCGGTSAALPDPEIKIYLLDLSGSGDVRNQFRLIQEDLAQDMTSESLGSPYLMTGPSLTKFYFVGTNSRALREFTLQDQKVVYDLFQYLSDENNNTNTRNFWPFLSEKYQTYMLEKLGTLNQDRIERESQRKNLELELALTSDKQRKIELERILRSINTQSSQSVSKDMCLADFDKIFQSTWSSDRVRMVYSGFMCRMAIYSLSNFEELQQYIDSESQSGVQKASDVFGSLSKIDSQIGKFQQEFTGSEIKVTLATDGDHNLGANSPSNLRPRIQSASDICSLVDEYRKEFELFNLTESPGLRIDPRGISALKKGTGEYPRQLESFWNCFFPEK